MAAAAAAVCAAVVSCRPSLDGPLHSIMCAALACARRCSAAGARERLVCSGPAAMHCRHCASRALQPCITRERDSRFMPATPAAAAAAGGTPPPHTQRLNWGGGRACTSARSVHVPALRLPSPPYPHAGVALQAVTEPNSFCQQSAVLFTCLIRRRCTPLLGARLVLGRAVVEHHRLPDARRRGGAVRACRQSSCIFLGLPLAASTASAVCHLPVVLGPCHACRRLRCACLTARCFCAACLAR